LPEPPTVVEQPPPPPPEPKPEPPRVAETRLPSPGPTQRGREIARAPSPRELPAPRRPSGADEKPKIVLESSRATMEADRGPVELGRLGIGQRPDQMIESAIQQMTERGGGPQAVGDGVGASAGGYAPPSPGNIGSGLELLSDPKGVDFRPYLLQLLNIVRRNWYAVIPESARLGLERGRVAVQFSVSKSGDVPKLVISSSSNSHPLDRAAVAGVSASLPFPPLPAEFTGDEIRLQFVFLYNQQR
jgi:TonB family protein